MKTSPYSRWHEEIGKYLAYRSTYYTSRWPAQPLRLFDRFAASHPRWTLARAVTQWLSSGGDRNPVTRSNYLSAIRRFCEYRRRFCRTSSFLSGRIDSPFRSEEHTSELQS